MNGQKGPQPWQSGQPITAQRLNDGEAAAVRTVLAGVGSVGGTLPSGAYTGQREGSLGGQLVQVLKIVDTVSGEGGRYKAKKFISPIKKDATGDLAENNLGTLPDDPDVQVWSPNEIGTSGHAITVGTVVGGLFLGFRSNDTGQPVYLLLGALLGSFPVRLQNRTGTPGSSTVISAELYDVYLLDNTTQIGTACVVDSSPCRGFPMLVQNAADRGLAYYDADSSLRIASCNESTDNKSCPPP